MKAVLIIGSTFAASLFLASCGGDRTDLETDTTTVRTETDTGLSFSAIDTVGATDTNNVLDISPDSLGVPRTVDTGASR